ncbi:hypothetical protein SDC9_181666 [bioreactor metagenome]|uniref:Uncharacterized protein n=1 Tax=bioreactor metagenome TaxID=1076179 RepID=A0A645HEG9_9ZZZZ
MYISMFFIVFNFLQGFGVYIFITFNHVIYIFFYICFVYLLDQGIAFILLYAVFIVNGFMSNFTIHGFDVINNLILTSFHYRFEIFIITDSFECSCIDGSFILHHIFDVFIHMNFINLFCF